MSVQYIFGGSAAGKTGFILNEIINEIINDTHRSSLIYIVPEQFSLQSEKNLISRLNAGASVTAQVLSFRRLAYHVFSETGGGDYFDDIGKTMLLRKLMYELKDELKFFVKTADKLGFMEQLADAVGEFYRYGVTPEKLLAYAETAGRGNLRGKLLDLALIYKGYIDYVESRYIPTDAMLDALAARLAYSERVKAARIWISGFHGFTPQELKVLAGLIKNAERVTIALTVKTSAKLFPKPSESDAFYGTKRTVNRITALANELGVRVDEPLLLRAKNTNPELDFLEENFLERSPKVYSKTPKSIAIYRADNQYNEIHQAAIQITELVREGIDYSGIAVLTGDLRAYERDIRNIFELYDIPVFLDVKTEVLVHPLVDLILSMLDIIVCNWSYESVFRFLKTGLTRLSRDEIDNLENYVLAYGIKGGRWAEKRWKYGFEEPSPYNEELLHRSKDYCQALLKPLKSKAKRCVREFSTAVFGVLDTLDVNETLRRHTEELEQRNPELARRNRQIWGKVCEVFDVLVEILGDEQMQIQEFAKILEAGFRATDMGLIPTAQIQVLAGDIERSRLPKVSALFVLGVNDGVLPSAAENNALIDDDERRLLDPNGEDLAPGNRRRGFEQQFLIYHALSAPGERLFLSYCTGRISGRAMRPSGLISKIKTLFPLLEEQPADIEHRITLARPMFARMGAALREFRDGRAEDLQLYGWFAKNEEYSDRLSVMRSIVFERIGGEAIDASALYGREFGLNVSKLERYVQCPFAYFIRYNLGALERRIYEARAVELGNLYHDALNLFTERLKERGQSWRTLDKPTIDRGVEECVEELAPKLGSEVLLSTARYRYVVRQAARVLKRSIWALAEHIKSGEFEIFATEIGFGENWPVKAVCLELANGKRLSLHGRIDRVDIADFDGKQYVKIIDYKSGSNKLDLDDIYFGTQLQLMLYMDAFIRSGAVMEAQPGGVFYFNLNDPVVDYDEKTLEQLDDEILRRFKMSGLALANTRVIKAFDSGIGRSSKIIPASINAKGEAGGGVASLEEFNTLRTLVTEKIKELGEKMTSGNINVLPYKKGEITGCAYCLYGAVCRFQKEKYNTVIPR